jgi:ELWxxDGT repeat protein
MIKDIRPGVGSNYSSYTVNINGTLYFTANDGTHGVELWKTDGTANGTVMVADLWSGKGSSYAEFLTNLNGTLYFYAEDPVRGGSLMRSDGTEAGTVPIANLVGLGKVRSPSNLFSVGNQLYYVTSTDAYGAELWKLNENKHTDITLAPNVISKNAGPNATVGALSSIDVNVGDKFTYTLVPGSGDTDNAKFKIEGGALKAVNNFAADANYTIRVRSTDQQGLWVEKVMTVQVGWRNQNPNNPFDVDNDKTVSPLDVLTVINLINAKGASLPVSGLPSPPPYYDVNGDDRIDPLDVLVLINEINARGGNGEGEARGEGEGNSARDVLFGMWSYGAQGFLDRLFAYWEQDLLAND